MTTWVLDTFLEGMELNSTMLVTTVASEAKREQSPQQGIQGCARLRFRTLGSEWHVAALACNCFRRIAYRRHAPVILNIHGVCIIVTDFIMTGVDVEVAKL